MKILAIETSCDDTSIAIIEAKKKYFFDILSNVVSSQVNIHKKWGGVYPTLAKREHQKNLVPVLKKALKEANLLQLNKIKEEKIKIIKKILEREPKLLNSFIKDIAKIKKPDIEALAVTVGPGLEPCLWAGINFAKALSFCWEIPEIPVNHIEAHILSAFANKNKVKFPAICLIASGGHTQLILMKKINNYKILGETRDDAAGECLDKTARILGLDYPGGPIIERRAKEASNKIEINLPRPMINTKDYDFSFSGLKTAVLYESKNKRKTKNYVNKMCKEIQQAVIDVLIKKTKKAKEEHNAKTVILGGGVTANKELRKQIKKVLPETILPDPKLCTDNAVMVAIAAYFNKKSKKDYKNIKAKANLRIS